MTTQFFRGLHLGNTLLLSSLIMLLSFYCLSVRSVITNPQFPSSLMPLASTKISSSTIPTRPLHPTEKFVYIVVFIQGVTRFLKKSHWLQLIPIVYIRKVIGGKKYIFIYRTSLDKDNYYCLLT